MLLNLGMIHFIIFINAFVRDSFSVHVSRCPTTDRPLRKNNCLWSVGHLLFSLSHFVILGKIDMYLMDVGCWYDVNHLGLSLLELISLMGFPSAFNFRGKFLFALISIPAKWSLQNVLQDTADVPSWHVQRNGYNLMDSNWITVWCPGTNNPFGFQRRTHPTCCSPSQHCNHSAIEISHWWLSIVFHIEFEELHNADKSIVEHRGICINLSRFISQ